jgi:hypothetical protein
MPKLYTSAFSLKSRLRITSGAMYKGVPRTAPRSRMASCDDSLIALSPKSHLPARRTKDKTFNVNRCSSGLRPQ